MGTGLLMIIIVHCACRRFMFEICIATLCVELWTTYYLEIRSWFLLQKWILDLVLLDPLLHLTMWDANNYRQMSGTN